jgi:hypothetical protein
MVSQRDHAEGEPKKNLTDDKEKFEKVVDELRNVLAGLNAPQAEEPMPITPPPADPIPSDDPFLRSSPTLMPPTMEPEKLGEAAFRQAAGLETPPPSDQDFWNGNVLGWPTVTPEAESPMNEPEAPLAVPGETPDVLPPPSVDDRMWLDGHHDSEIPQIFPSNPEPELPPEPKRRESAPVATPYDDMMIPPAPRPPSPPNDEDVPPAGIILGSFGGSEEHHSPYTASPDEGEEAPEPSRTVLPANLKIPVPGTLHQLPPTKKPKMNEDTLEQMDIHNASVFGIACFFPDGHEGEADEFIKKLKAALAASSHSNLRFDAILLNPWTPGQVNAHAWKKAASLSGANFLFVIAPRHDKELFKDISRPGHKDEIKTRLVFLEQVPLRALYADLLADVLRSLNVKD